MNQVKYQISTKYGTPAINKYVDLNRPIVSVTQSKEDEHPKQIYVSLTEQKKERKKSDLQIRQFAAYLKMKAAFEKFSNCIEHDIDNIINTIQEEKEYDQHGTNANGTDHMTCKRNFKITATNSPSAKVNPNHFERNTTRNLNQSQEQQRQHRRLNVQSRLNHTYTVEKNNTNSYSNISRESADSPSTSFNSTKSKVGPRLPHSNTKQKIQSNATTRCTRLSVSTTNHQSTKSAVSSKVNQNNIPKTKERKKTNSYNNISRESADSRSNVGATITISLKEPN